MEPSSALSEASKLLPNHSPTQPGSGSKLWVGEISAPSASSPGAGLQAAGPEGSPHSSAFHLAPSAAAAGTVGRGFSLLPVQALVQPAADTLAGGGEAILGQ